MGRAGSAVAAPERREAAPPGHERLDAEVPVLYTPRLFGESFLQSIFHALWEEDEIVDGERAEELLGDALGQGGREWLLSRPEF